MRAVTKEQRKALRAEQRTARAARMKRELGETIARKGGLVLASYGAGLAPGMGPVRTATAMTVVGWGGALALGGKIGSALEGIGDAGAAVSLARMGSEKRLTLARDHFLRGAFFEASGDAGAAAPAVRAAERRAFAAGRVAGLRDGVRSGVGAMRETVDLDETAGGSSAAELVEAQIAEADDGL